MTLVGPAHDVPSSTRLADRVVARVTTWIGRSSRRSFLVRAAVVGSALAVNPLRYVLRPGTAYAAVCGPANTCAGGWTVFCCTINGGRNTCPPGSITAGWWKTDTSPFCGGGPRYILDCNATCSCGCGASGICSSACITCRCGCGDASSCDQRRVCCNEFRYGQCHQEVACVGPVVCRVVSCIPPWEWDTSCTAASATENRTTYHSAPCLDTADDASVYAFGSAEHQGDPEGRLTQPVVGMDATPTGAGYWLVASDGGVFAFGDARFFGSTGTMRLHRPIVDLAATPTGGGYWLVASDGGIFAFGDAEFFGSTGTMVLDRAVVGMASTPSGRGYWLVASDGGIFAFGDARFYGSTGGMQLAQPIVGMASTPTGLGYWLVAVDGGVFSFGDARFFGSLADSGEPRGAVVDAEAAVDGAGYWMLTD